MKHLILLSVLFLLPALAGAQKISDEQIEFANRFQKAVADHNKKTIFRLLDKSYRKSQTKFLGGSKDQLLNELFSGTGIADENFVVISIDDIQKIEIAEIEENANGSYTYIFRVRDGEHDILAPLELIKKGKRYGFVGAVG